ncbi:interaptin-like [Mercenaria mercenaria]|uniref:interaptin-like n=1 Tax=Mercenaria mercenaria TaxID=6596 RepID=UPI00234F6907|nr:interaptin-like [Mercenaria mercenaria]
MSWRGSTGHLDANVPDYQKMLQGRYPSSGWSSTQPSLPSYSSRFPGASGHSSHYINQRHNTSSLSRPNSHSSYSNTYQPSKYGLAADSSYNSTLDSNFRTVQADKSTSRPENGYNDRNYGFVGREFDLEPYRSSSHRGTDYSSDSGRGRTSRQTMDYSSDSGMSFRHQSRKLSDFELEIPSPDTSRNHSRSQNDELFNSPTKSQLPASEYLGYNDNHAIFEDQGKHERLADYRHISKSEPNLDKYQGIGNGNNVHSTDEEEFSPQHEDEAETDVNHHLEEDVRANFVSPEIYHGEIGDTTLAHRDTKLHLKRNKAGDLTQWQQKQRNSPAPEHSRLVLKPSYHNEKPLRDYSPSIHDNHHSYDSDRLRPHDPHDMTSPRHHDITDMKSHNHRHSSEQLNHIQSAADAIIRDKDAIIDEKEERKARMHGELLELKDRVVGQDEMIKELENKLRRSLMSRGGNTEDSATFSKMQDLEFRNAELRSELAKLKLQKDTEVEDLEIKLGYLLERDEEVGEWKRKHLQLTNNYKGLKEKLGGMERYLADLPTLEEFTKNAEDLATCNEENELKSAQVAELEEKLKDTTQQLSERDSTIHELEGKQQQLAHKMRELTVEIKRIKSEGEGKALAEAQDELADTRETKDRAIHDLEKAKKLLEVNHRRLRQLEAKHQTEIRQVQERLAQEEESVVALREEIRLKEEQVAKLKRSIKDFANKNQDLMDETLVLREQLKQFEQTSEDENQKLQRRFVREMSFCFSELQSLVQICVQQAEGKDPNISLLLGTRASLDEEGATGCVGGDEQSLKHWFSKLKELRSEVEKVRNMMCNKYAKEMGDNLNCATQ